MKLSRPWSPALRRAFDLGVHRFTWVGYRLHPKGHPHRHGVRMYPDVAYRQTGRRAHRLDIYRPSGVKPRPAILYVHGGAFSMLSKDTHRIMALALASQGYVVFNINYRLGPTHLYPKPLADASAALLWMLEHGAEYGADTSRVAIAGESAGGNLTAALTYIATHPRPEPFARAVYERNPPLRCVLPIYGIHDLNDIERFWRQPDKAKKMAAWVKRELRWAGTSYVGHPLEERAEACPLASPLHLYEQPAPSGARPLPPFFLTAGTADPLLDDSRRLKEAVEARGAECELHVYTGEIHGFNAMLWRPAARAKWREVFRFLERHLDPESGHEIDHDDHWGEEEDRSDAA